MYRHFCFDIPCSRKMQSCQSFLCFMKGNIKEELFKIMNKFLTKTQQGRASIVTDSKAGIVGAVESQTNFTHLFCWRHLFKDKHDWIDKNLGT